MDLTHLNQILTNIILPETRSDWTFPIAREGRALVDVANEPYCSVTMSDRCVVSQKQFRNIAWGYWHNTPGLMH